MKKVISIALLGMIIILAPGCLKDKGFDRHEYGINSPVSAPGTTTAGVGFPLAINNINTISLEAFNTTGQSDTISLVVNLEASQPATSDVHVQLTLDNTLVTSYNTANNTSIVLFDPQYYNITTLNVVIPQGQTFVRVPITIPNTSNLSLDSSYGLGFHITAVDAPYTIASNLKDLLLQFNIKNKYDGNYTSVIKTVGWAAYGISDNLPGLWPSLGNQGQPAPPAGFTARDSISIGMVTTGANTVKIYDYWGFDTYIQNAFTTGNASATGFGATAPELVFDNNTLNGENMLTDVRNTAAPDPRNRQFHINSSENSRYDVATKTIYAAYVMTQDARPDQFIYDTFRYASVRPY